MITEADVVGVDEAQFFDGTLLATCAALTDAGKRIIVAGLDRTCFGDPFEPVPALAGAAGHVTRLQARCARCDQPAEFTQRLIDDKHPDDVHHNDPGLIGADDQYEPRCRTCFAPVHAAV
jgi:thymidine kinase